MFSLLLETFSACGILTRIFSVILKRKHIFQHRKNSTQKAKKQLKLKKSWHTDTVFYTQQQLRTIIKYKLSFSQIMFCIQDSFIILITYDWDMIRSLFNAIQTLFSIIATPSPVKTRGVIEISNSAFKALLMILPIWSTL